MRKRAKRVTPTCASVCIFIPWSWECVRHTTTTHTTTHNDAHQHTTKHTNKTRTTHQHTHHTPHTNTQHTTHTHTAHRVRANMSGPERWWTVLDKGAFSWSLGTTQTCKSFVTFRSACFPQDRWSWTIFYQVKRMIGGIGNMLFWFLPNFKMGKIPHLGEPMVHMTTPHVALNCLIHCLPSGELILQFSASIVIFRE